MRGGGGGGRGEGEGEGIMSWKCGHNAFVCSVIYYSVSSGRLTHANL